MRKIYLFIILSLMVVGANAKQVDATKAKSIAQQFMMGKKGISIQFEEVVTTRAQAVQESNLYVFNVENNGGFVIVSGDDRTQSILGYASKGHIDMDNLPCNVKWLFDRYDKAIASLPATYQPSATRASDTKTAIEPLVNTQWGQSSPYNSLCPQVNGNECLTGCVATAMAQVINYNRWPQEATSSVPAYISQTNEISMPALAATTFDWNNMSSSAIAKLMLYCGQSVEMDYSTGGSGAAMTDVAPALRDVFGYSKSVNYKFRDTTSSEDWDGLIYDELSAGRAVLFGGQSTSGGHAFVVDGYSDSKYHINWGWNGYCDGYFALDDLDPTNSGGFNSEQEIVYNIAPPAGSADVTRPKAVVTKMTTSSSFLERASASADFASLTISSTLQSDLSETATIQIGFALYNDNGLVKVLATGSHEFTTTESYTYEAPVTIDSSIPQGEYRLVAVNRSSDSDEWLTDVGSSDVYISVTVNETGMILKALPSGNNDGNNIEFGTHTVDGISYRFYSQYDNYLAEVQPLSDDKKYSGDIYVPDSVSYQNIKFEIVSSTYKAFDSCTELTSLSIGSRSVGSIYGCSNLKTLEIREGVIQMNTVQSCNAIENITFPSSCSYAYTPSRCENLKSIIFKNKKSFKILYSKYLSKDINPSLTDIYFAGDIPPSAYRNVISSPNENVKIHIPAGSLEVYNNSDWKDWTLVEDQPAMPSEVYWDYCGYDNDSGSGICIGAGSNNIEFGMRMPADQLEAYKGCRISAIEYYTTTPSVNDSQEENVEYVFITKSDGSYLAKQSVKTNRGTWMTVKFDQPYTITGDELYVGIGKNGTMMADFTSNDVVNDAFYYRYSTTDGASYGTWSYLGDVFSNGGNRPLPIRAIIEGDNLPTDVAIISTSIENGDEETQSNANVLKSKKSVDLSLNNDGFFAYMIDEDGNVIEGQTVALKAKGVQQKVKATAQSKLKVKLWNRSPKTVKQVVLDWNVDDKYQGQQTVETSLLMNHGEEVYIDVPYNISGSYHTMTVSVASVDGATDAIPANSTAVVTYTTDGTLSFSRKIVMEEATGTWCGWCPRGIVGIELLNKKYPDNFIAIAVHDDTMRPASDSYAAYFDKVTGYPTSYINRSEWIDPRSFAYKDTKIQNMLSDCIAGITAQASFVDNEEKVKVNTECQFGFNVNGSTEYRIAYVLVEDSVGPYNQKNYYSDPTTADDESNDMNWWIHQGSVVSTIYNDVARKIYDDYYGVSGSLPTSITEGDIYKSEYTLELPDNVQNPKNLKVVTLIINCSTGEILNADRTAITGSLPSGIATVVTDANESFDIYNLQGVKVRSKVNTAKGLTKGIYIVNGKKIVVR